MMPNTDHRAALKEIRTFPSLVRYLRDEMGWPIDRDDFEELNVLNLLEGGKKVVVYVTPQREFLTFRTFPEVTELLHDMNPVAVAHLDRKIGFRRRLGAAKDALSPT